MTAASLLLALDAEQRAAVTAPADAVIVLAGAGSGKTTVLTRRIVYRIEDASADAEHTLAITFTREAAAQLKRRSPRGIHTGTFHAIAFALLRQRLTDLNKTMPTILTNSSSMMREATHTLGMRTPIFEALTEYEWMQARALSPNGYPGAATAAKRNVKAPEAFVRLFEEFERLKKFRGVLDIGDLLVRATDEIKGSVDYAGAVHWRYRHLLVDEAQDMNPQQFAFLEALRGGRRDIFMVGDPLQAIYGWNGADPRLFDDLPQTLGGATVVHLRNNYRCSPVVIDAGLHILRSNGVAAEATAVKLDGEAITLDAFDDETAEARGIATRVSNSRRGVRRWADVAVLVRTRAQRDLIVAAFEKAGIPLSASAASAVVAPLLQEVAALTNRYALADWSLELRIASEKDSAEHELALLVNEFLAAHPMGPANGTMFMSWFSTSAPRPSGDDGVEVLTFHAAKGREWHTVFIAGAEKGVLPHSSAKTPAGRAEEVRLAYVAVTRAAERLCITWARRRGSRATALSPFVVGLPMGETTHAAMPADLREIGNARNTGTALGALRDWRRERARRLGTTESAVCADVLLQRIADRKPTTTEQLAQIVGPMTAAVLAGEVLAVVVGFSGSNPQ
ncbi:MAG: ATP-dependent helicase [Actinobacteria bacterium]|nr:ATP-dependent helicase [Actinomycetota bacterium]